MSEEKNPENYGHIVDYPGQEEPNLIPILRSSAKIHHMVFHSNMRANQKVQPCRLPCSREIRDYLMHGVNVCLSRYSGFQSSGVISCGELEDIGLTEMVTFGRN